MTVYKRFRYIRELIAAYRRCRDYKMYTLECPRLGGMLPSVQLRTKMPISIAYVPEVNGFFFI